jgi:site-specific DNA recombinase
MAGPCHYSIDMAQSENSTVRVALYLRCSTAEQAADGVSLEAQEGRLRAWADAVGAEVVEVITDAAVSGGKPLAERKGGARVATLLDARKPEVDAVVIMRLDRLGRDAAETLALLKRFRASRVGLISVADRLDLGTPQGRAMAGMAAVFGELEKGLAAARTTEALSELRRQGRAWNHAPFGWDAVDGRLVENDAEQTTLARIRNLRAEGFGYKALADRLNDEKVPTKRAGSKWHAASVRGVLISADKTVGVRALVNA